MRIEVRHPIGPAGVAVVRVIGKLDASDHQVDRLRAALDELVASSVRNVVVDLTDTTAVVSRAFGQMLVALSRLRTRGGDLRVAGARGNVLEIAHRVGLADVVELHHSIEEGIASFARP